MLLISLGSILAMGLFSHPDPQHIEMSSSEAFYSGIKVGYNTLDLIASFIFAPLVLSHFVMDTEGFATPANKLRIFKKMIKASLLAAFLLCVMYIGLTYVASYYVQFIGENVKPEERLSAISFYLLGPYGAMFSCIAVAMACLTTAIPLVSIFAEYMKKDLFKDQIGSVPSLIITLIISSLIANLGFMGIANMLSPVLQILCPGLIVLSLQNIFHKLYETRVQRLPIFATFAFSTLLHVI
jgi:LIVCS family branched-chain amino acid:cation transporter